MREHHKEIDVAALARWESRNHHFSSAGIQKLSIIARDPLDR
jgi:DNA-binding transcriptional regulator YiaG